MILRCQSRVVTFPRPLVMGILNINDDSFCGDGSLDEGEIFSKARSLIAEGADILDVGAESARTNRPPISVAEEIRRFAMFQDIWKDLSSVPERPLLSLNAWRPETLRVVEADIFNDMSGLPDATNARVAADKGAALLLMHTQGLPKQAHAHVTYQDVLMDVEAFFERKIALAVHAGMDRDALILDVGFDFAKQREDNLKILAHLRRFSRWERPLLLPVSRKSFIGWQLDLPEPRDRDAGTVAAVMAGVRRGGSIFRVHNVAATVSALRVWEAVSQTEEI